MNNCKTLAIQSSLDGALQIFWVNSRGVLLRAVTEMQKIDRGNKARFHSHRVDFNFGSDVVQIQNGKEFLLVLTRAGRLFQVANINQMVSTRFF